MQICAHCDEAAPLALFSPEDTEQKQPFCCAGCLTVFKVIHAKGLESYYQIKKDSAVYKRRSPVDLEGGQFHYLDDAQFLEEYSFRSSEGHKVMEFYLEGIHCLACLWLIERLPDFVPGVCFSKLNIERSVATITLGEEGKFSSAARELHQLGYRPHALKLNQKAVDLKARAERSNLIRIGVAGAAAGNIMIYAVSLYGGATKEYSGLFNLLTVLFAIPVLTYSAFPLYQNAWHALRNRTLSIDIPISLSLIAGAIMGLYNLAKGIPDNYFDSLTALVFLLLLSRYFLQKIQERGLSASDLNFFYQSESIERAVDPARPEEFVDVHPDFLRQGDVLRIRPGSLIPADGVIVRGSSYVNNSLLTGESLPVKVATGEKVFSGTQNQDQEILVRVEKTKNETRLGQILRNVENGWSHRSGIVNLTNRVSKYFTVVVICLAGVLFALHARSGNYSHALELAITLLIVTCPCALALATPLTFTRVLSQAAAHGMIIKNDEVLEKVSQVKTIYLDKTGTMTYGRLEVADFRKFDETIISLPDVIFSLESRSRHPVARALMAYVTGLHPKTHAVENFNEQVGFGVAGTLNGFRYEINRAGIFEEGRRVAEFSVKDSLRNDSRRVIDSLSEMGLEIRLLSGDSPEAVKTIAVEAGLSPEKALASLTPEKKSELVSRTPFAMMVGDGANDAIALTKAHVGVAVLGAMDISLRAADVYLSTPGLVPVEKLVTLSQETMKVVYRNLFLSLLYNSLSVIAVFSGIINPLVAAIIMPLSSLTVLLSSLIGTKKMRALWK